MIPRWPAAGHDLMPAAGMGMASSDDCIVDHCSISWSSDEGFRSRGAKNITVQRCLIAEALDHSYHYRASDRTKFASHAFAASISGEIGSFHSSCIALRAASAPVWIMSGK